MSSHWFNKPENALKRAQELIGIGNKQVAMELLHGVLTARRFKTWQKAYELIMLKYLDLCVELQQHRYAKDGLHQYRNMSQQQAPASLELVILHLVESAEERVAKAREAADASAASAASAAAELQAATQIGDLEAEVSPESIMLSTMTEDGSKERLDRQLVVPWLKFLWETYRAVLDILRSNSKLEHVYHKISCKAFDFCQVYKRLTEFRRLCDTLRQHVGHLQKHVVQNTTARLKGWDGFTSESIELHLQTRFSQLEVATNLELWTEGFRTIEDIYAIMQIGNKVPKARLMASYYEKLTRIFWVSGNYLFHAYAWYKYYHLSCEFNKNLTAEERMHQASSVLLATLSIPSVEQAAVTGGGLKQAGEEAQAGYGGAKKKKVVFDEDDMAKQKHSRMATLLYFNSDPNRSALLEELMSKDMLSEVDPVLKDMYLQVEKTFKPLTLVSDLQPTLKWLKEHKTLSMYAHPMERLLVLRTLGQLSSIYHTVKMDRFQELIAGLDIGPEEVEILIVRAVKENQLKVRVDHQMSCLRFGAAAFEDDTMRSQLTNLAAKLQKVVDTITVDNKEALEARAQARADFFQQVQAGMQDEHLATLNRKQIIEKRKEELERQQQERAREEAQQKQVEETKRKQEETLRLEREAKLREHEKQQKIEEEMELQRTRDLLKSMGKDVSEQDIGKVDSAQLIQETREQAIKAKEEAEKRLKEQSRRLDYITRALRMDELPILAAKYKAQCETDLEEHEAQWVQLQAQHRQHWELSIKEKQRTRKMLAFQPAFEDMVMKVHSRNHQAQLDLARKQAREARVVAIIARARRRKMEEEEERAQEEELLRQEAEAKAEEEERQRQRLARMVPNQGLMDDEDDEDEDEGGDDYGSTEDDSDDEESDDSEKDDGRD
eukprot:CAMPEP_0113937048 /NCGR_PEP_ID=MMETSP1339-20121228/3751_1 /TAXON_ID=94617 /ORGANISM="Fibrocapsa japonica" /LENGTH=893 /DNA_ID=CAMNT_0000939673 /DNA_START=127 /DNA_END=2808 /DNA_ORIENTATION=+ /assembly_acc=CAM_ASM_000762